MACLEVHPGCFAGSTCSRSGQAMHPAGVGRHEATTPFDEQSDDWLFFDDMGGLSSDADGLALSSSAPTVLDVEPESQLTPEEPTSSAKGLEHRIFSLEAELRKFASHFDKSTCSDSQVPVSPLGLQLDKDQVLRMWQASGIGSIRCDVLSSSASAPPGMDLPLLSQLSVRNTSFSHSDGGCSHLSMAGKIKPIMAKNSNKSNKGSGRSRARAAPAGRRARHDARRANADKRLRVKGRFVKRTDLDLEHLTLEESVPAAGPEGQGTTTSYPAAAAASAVAASPPQS
ncbi:hypothetical protein ACKKBF_B09340 [Auxenochlorella protothecoides x Auxenochlorella symbiontica]